MLNILAQGLSLELLYCSIVKKFSNNTDGHLTHTGFARNFRNCSQTLIQLSIIKLFFLALGHLKSIKIQQCLNAKENIDYNLETC